MGRLVDHLDEGYSVIKADKNLDIINDLIQKNCRQYLKQIRGLRPLYRGMETDYALGEKDVRKNRAPLGMPRKTASFLNDWLEKTGHNRRDKSVMATSDSNHIELFGFPFMIFPLGRFSYTWVETQDINMGDYEGWSQDTVEIWMYKQQGKTHMDDFLLNNLKKPFEQYFHTDVKWDKAIQKKYEIWINCKSYYFARDEFFQWDFRNQRLEVRK